jgi:hypothetical protein
MFVLLLLCLSLPALPAMAGSGIAVGPSRIDIEDAMRGARYDSQVSIFNGGDQTTDYRVTVEGEAAAWVSLAYQGEALTTITVSPATREFFDVTVAVPEDTANGNYSARITVTSITTASGAGQAVSLAAYADINLAVSGTQNISGKVNGITVKDQETGFPVLFQVYFENTGNVAVSPGIDVIIDWEGKPVDSFNYSGTEMGPSQKDFIDVEWDTTGQTPGDYGAKVNVSLDGQQIYTQDLNFKILALGSMTRSGELRDITVEGTLQAGKLAKINGVFANTGDADVLAKLTGEIYLEGSLLQVLEGDEVMVDRGIQATVSAYFTPAQEGKYTIKGQVDFGGKKTDIKEVALDISAVQNAGATTEPANPPNENTGTDTGKGPFGLSWPIIGGGAGGLLVIVVVIFLFTKMR